MLTVQNQLGWRERPRGRNSAVPLAGTCWLCRISTDGGKDRGVAIRQFRWREHAGCSESARIAGKTAGSQLGSSAGGNMLAAQNQHGWRERPRGRNSAVPTAETCWLCRISTDGGKTCPAAICRRAKRRLQMSSLYKAPWQGDANGHADSVRPVATGGQVRMSEARRCERCFARTVDRRSNSRLDAG